MFLQPVKQRRKSSPRSVSICFLNRHEPDRRSATWDGAHYTGNCTKCGARIRRKAHKDWRRDWVLAKQKKQSRKAEAC